MSEHTAVIIIEDNEVQEFNLCEDYHAGRLCFITQCNIHIPDFDTYAEDEIQALVDEGAVHYSNKSVNFVSCFY
jgi:hypothetical protein